MKNRLLFAYLLVLSLIIIMGVALVNESKAKRMEYHKKEMVIEEKPEKVLFKDSIEKSKGGIHWFWAIVMLILVVNAIRSYFKIETLKEQLWLKDKKIEELHSKKSYEEPKQEAPDIDAKKQSATSTKPKRDWQSIRANKVDGKYLRPRKDLEDKSHFFYGKKVVITGNFEAFPYREEIARMLWEVGADIDTTVTKRTHFLVAGSEYGLKKMELALEFGTTILNENEFLAHFPKYKPRFT